MWPTRPCEMPIMCYCHSFVCDSWEVAHRVLVAVVDTLASAGDQLVDPQEMYRVVQSATRTTV